MDFDILHQIPGRMRVRLRGVTVNGATANAIGQLLTSQDGVLSAVLSVRTGNLLILYSRVVPPDHVLALLSVMEPADWDGFGLNLPMPQESLFEITLTAVIKTAVFQVLKLILLPAPIRYAGIILEALPYIAKGVGALGHRRMDVAVLDATALSILTVRRDFASMRTILWLFSASEALEDWTREQSRQSLAASLALKVDTVWLEMPTGEVKRPLTEVRPGDLVIVETGGIIPVDGIVDNGEALVNQSALTGESEAVHKCVGLSVFAGTAIDEGRLVVRVTKAADETRLQDIIRFIEESENLKAGVQSKAERLADAIVPYSLGLALAVLALTRNPIRASAVLMVDYSCAIRMSTPLTILNAIQEGVLKTAFSSRAASIWNIFPWRIRWSSTRPAL